MRLSQKTAPAARALDWMTEVRQHLRLDSDDEQDRFMGILVPAAEQWAESATGRQLVTATWQMWMSCFPGDGCPIWLPHMPLQSVTHVKYYDSAGVQQTWAAANYTVDAPVGPKCGPGRIVPKAGISYPSTYGSPYEVEIEWGAGYSTVPALMKQGLLSIVGDLFEHREASISGAIIEEVPFTARALILPFAWEMP
jgi:uncharacterized phiE125 gp8 family phage protein